ncbi:MAG: hypothetical protein A2445_04725 [Candidatus Jacksonbacteria bacterium RIFOXYC2_FULL_44_29]|nr:MAG: hypothetical protein UW45_C0041G0007 [Parcubacteria group bacterium GW2011_GWC2_44_22]OGY74456.1 MAG: hypothetical protein A2240_02585 [Candidatus Jacksonbacteria bacterium RIFOXYA2_FULL_43_12]OGY77026.1 MAG: hypothetical protein A2295_00560 [Candidatus Jacksonbacteria bacterium RIFOXYB2_FULL_44_15]OGY78055.1 MAG: hypothetical protein A2550_03440 [Candidatus Jacksonbacteria bacterium RIFOXYD2_FULL_43_21]OGY79729.1 MAG: hypothetical protein A2445_04725 [Candidatus Jacksonbacteria bacteri
MLNLIEFAGFDWDEGNRYKNWLKHQVSNDECEEVFFNQPLLFLSNEKHSRAEKRFHALGRTNYNRLLLVAFTLRRDLIRIISARQMNKKEKIIYEKVKTDS